MIDTGKNTTKTLMHYVNIFLIVLIFILSVLSFLFLKPFYLIPGADVITILISSLYLIFSIVIAISGIFYPENPTKLSAKIKRNIFLIKILALLLDKDKIHGLAALGEGKSLKTIRRQWNAPAVFILGILLLLVEFFTALIISGSETLDIRFALTAFASYPYGKILIALFIGWILLFITASVWFYIDTKENIQVTENIKPKKQDMPDSKRIMIKCGSCGNIFNYNQYDGICPGCGKYNQITDNDFYYENPYKKKKTIFALVKTYGCIIGIFCAILIISIIKYQIDYGNGLHSIPIPSFKHQSGNSITQEETGAASYTAEEIHNLLDDIKSDNGFKDLYHKELYKYNLTDASGEEYNEVTILITTKDSEKVYWYQFFKYFKTSENHKSGEIVFNMGAESDTLTKSDILAE